MWSTGESCPVKTLPILPKPVHNAVLASHLIRNRWYCCRKQKTVFCSGLISYSPAHPPQFVSHVWIDLFEDAEDQIT